MKTKCELAIAVTSIMDIYNKYQNNYNSHICGVIFIEKLCSFFFPNSKKLKSGQLRWFLELSDP